MKKLNDIDRKAMKNKARQELLSEMEKDYEDTLEYGLKISTKRTIELRDLFTKTFEDINNNSIIIEKFANMDIHLIEKIYLGFLLGHIIASMSSLEILESVIKKGD